LFYFFFFFFFVFLGFFLFFFFFFGKNGDLDEGRMLVMQVLYHLSHAPNPEGVHFLIAQVAYAKFMTKDWSQKF
jgi:hypothetical protein